MKNLLILTFLLLFSSFTGHTQTGTITDKETYVEITYPSGDVISLGKSQIVSLKSINNDVYIMTSQNWAQDKVTKIAMLNYSEFGYPSAQSLRAYLSLLFFNSYKAEYHYTAGAIDTVSYFAGDSLAFKIAYAYSDGNISEKSAPINE